MTRPVLAELRRSGAAAVGVAVLLGLLLWARPDEWAQGWIGLSLTLRNDLPVLVPVAVAAGAWLGGRDRRARTEELLGTTPRPTWHAVLLRAGILAAAVVTALALVLVVVGLVHGRGDWLQQWWPAAVVATGLLAVAAGALLGAALGLRVRSNLVAPLALVLLGVVLLAFEATSYASSWTNLLGPAIEPTTLVARQVRTGATAGQAVWFAALLVTGAALAAARRRSASLLALLPAVVGFVVAVPLLQGDGGTAYAVDRTAARLVCASGSPQVCVTRVHAGALGTTTAAARTVLARLQQLPAAPVRAVELLDDGPAPRGVLGISPLDPSARAADATHDLAQGLGEPLCPSTPPGGPVHDYDARTVAGAWLLGEVRDTYTTPAGERALARLRALPRREQRERMVTLRSALRSCDRDAFAVLP